MGSQKRSRSRSRRKARSRSPSLPPTPITPSDAFQVSGEEDLFAMRFVCKLFMMTSGDTLPLLQCDHLTSVGSVRAYVWSKIAKKEIASVQLFRGEHICSNDDIKVYELFTNFEIEDDCVLGVVLNHKIEKQNQEVNGQS